MHVIDYFFAGEYVIAKISKEDWWPAQILHAKDLMINFRLKKQGEFGIVLLQKAYKIEMCKNEIALDVCFNRVHFGPIHWRVTNL